MTHSSIQNLRMFRKLCGDHNLKNVVLATTKWGVTPLEDGSSQRKRLEVRNRVLVHHDGCGV
ncbi:hypothetical protein XPA_003889 [Xanthoria parietina]